MSGAPFVVQTTGLRKSFTGKGGPIQALVDVDLAVAPAQVFGFLGPNGAGKTTMLRILTTLMRADAGKATVAGHDVSRRPGDVRRRIGYVGQLGGADHSATGRENLLLQARLYGLSAADAKRRSAQAAATMDLDGLLDRIVRTYSGGQRRRLEVALGIIHRPDVLFLDEPTTGLDLQNRANLWEQIRALKASGTTIFLTTHYLEEADQLSDRVAIIDHGRVIVEGTPDELKRRLASGAVTITPKTGSADVGDLSRDFAREPFVREARVTGASVQLYVTDTTQAVAAILARLRNNEVELQSVSVAEPTLDDVFLHETGRSLRDAEKTQRQEAA